MGGLAATDRPPSTTTCYGPWPGPTGSPGPDPSPLCASLQGRITHEHFLKVVQTVHEYLYGYVRETYEYTVNSNLYRAARDGCTFHRRPRLPSQLNCPASASPRGWEWRTAALPPRYPFGTNPLGAGEERGVMERRQKSCLVAGTGANFFSVEFCFQS